MNTEKMRFSFNAKSICWDKGETLIDEVSISVNTGEIIGLVGPSGCGKSTILKAFAGRDKRIKADCLRKRISSNANESGLSIDDCVLMPQDSLDGLLTWYNTEKYLKIVSADRQKLTRTYLIQLVEQLGLPSNVLSELPLNLSGGQRRRVLLLATLLTQCDVAFLDEPFVGLDLDVRKKAIDFLRLAITSRNEHFTGCGAAIVVSHSLEDLSMLCEKVAVANLSADRKLTFKILDFSAIKVEKEFRKVDELLWRQNLIRKALGY